MRRAPFETWYEMLSGHWEIARVIKGEQATLRGTASLLPDGPCALAYRENGQLVLSDGRILEAYRNYRYRFSDRTIEVDFGDGPDLGKLFVRLIFGYSRATQMEASDTHYCGNDIYRVLYRLKLPSVFETDIAVSGPKKAYRAISLYNKLS